MLCGVLDAKGALLLINTAGGDGVVAVEDLPRARCAQQGAVGDLRAAADVVDIDYARRELRHRGEAQYVYRQRQIGAWSAGDPADLFDAMMDAEEDMIEVG